jgi:hypothetical protein
LGLRRRSREFETRHCEQREEKKAQEQFKCLKARNGKNEMRKSQYHNLHNAGMIFSGGVVGEGRTC